MELGLPTVRALTDAPEESLNGAPNPERYERLRSQAAIQVASRESGRPLHRHLPPARAAGYALLPPRSPGDVFFDLEGDPYVGEGGIEYLWGWWSAETGYECAWAHHEVAEKAAFERFVDRVTELRARHPDLHLYHYPPPHERSKLSSLSIHYTTCEEEVDDLLRSEVLVDIYAVVRQGMQVGEESYGLKAFERHHGFRRLEHLGRLVLAVVVEEEVGQQASLGVVGVVLRAVSGGPGVQLLDVLVSAAAREAAGRPRRACRPSTRGSLRRAPRSSRRPGTGTRPSGGERAQRLVPVGGRPGRHHLHVACSALGPGSSFSLALSQPTT